MFNLRIWDSTSTCIFLLVLLEGNRVWKHYNVVTTNSYMLYLLCRGMLEQARLPPSSEHTYAMWLQKPNQQTGDVVQPSPYKLALPPAVEDIQRVVVPWTEPGTSISISTILLCIAGFFFQMYFCELL